MSINAIPNLAPNITHETTEPLQQKTNTSKNSPNLNLNSTKNTIPELPTHSGSVIGALCAIFQKETGKDRSLTATLNSDNQITINTKDGYAINLLNKQQEWQITAPDGKTTRIWGDPHVVESDGDKWDFTKQSTFCFGDNKITVETTPYKNNPEMTVTKSITIYNGKDRITINDIDLDRPKISTWEQDAKIHDEALDDGDIYVRSILNETEQWLKDSPH